MAKDRTVTFRIPEDLHEWFKGWSAENERSTNRQFIVLLRQAKEQAEQAAAAEAGKGDPNPAD